MAVVKLRKEAAGALGITVKSLGDWKNVPGFPHREDGQYDVEAIRAWRDAQQKKGSEADTRVAQVNMAIKLQRLEEIKRKNLLLQLSIDEKNSKLVPRELVHDVLMEFAGMIRNLGKTLQQSGNDAAAKMIDVQVDRMKKLLSEKLAQ